MLLITMNQAAARLTTYFLGFLEKRTELVLKNKRSGWEESPDSAGHDAG